MGALPAYWVEQSSRNLKRRAVALLVVITTVAAAAAAAAVPGSDGVDRGA